MNGLLHSAGALVAIGVFVVAGCSSQDQSCPAQMPSTGDACNIANDPSVPGLGYCGYATDTNECGAADCYCEHGAWRCSPTCGPVTSRDASLVDGRVDADGPAIEASDSDISDVEASISEGSTPIDASAEH
jgi:hypothetical protein